MNSKMLSTHKVVTPCPSTPNDMFFAQCQRYARSTGFASDFLVRTLKILKTHSIVDACRPRAQKIRVINKRRFRRYLPKHSTTTFCGSFSVPSLPTGFTAVESQFAMSFATLAMIYVTRLHMCSWKSGRNAPWNGLTRAACAES